jgi:hypothetical protein
MSERKAKYHAEPHFTIAQFEAAYMVPRVRVAYQHSKEGFALTDQCRNRKIPTKRVSLPKPKGKGKARLGGFNDIGSIRSYPLSVLLEFYRSQLREKPNPAILGKG